MTDTNFFEKIYAIYPTAYGRRNRTQAEKAWKKKRPAKYTDQEMYERVQAWVLYWKKSGQDLKYIPLLSTWINSKYKDDIPSLQTAIIRIQANSAFTCIKNTCSNVVVHKGTMCQACMKAHQQPTQEAAEQFCIDNGLYVRGETPRLQALANMRQFMHDNPVGSRPKIHPRYKK